MILTPEVREARVTLRASERATFNVSLVDRGMRSDGAILTLPELRSHPETREIADRVLTAKPFLDVSLTKVQLEAGEPKQLLVSLRGQLPPPGEYRTHLTLIASLPEPPQGSPPAATVQWVHALPVILRVGPVDVRAHIDGASVRRSDGAEAPFWSQSTVTFDLVSDGANSLFGDVIVRNQNGEELAAMRGIAVYPETRRRRFAFGLPQSAWGSLDLVFVDQDREPGKVLARHRLAGAVQLVASGAVAARTEQNACGGARH